MIAELNNQIDDHKQTEKDLQDDIFRLKEDFRFKEEGHLKQIKILKEVSSKSSFKPIGT